jgi:hypothetical protein
MMYEARIEQSLLTLQALLGDGEHIQSLAIKARNYAQQTVAPNYEAVLEVLSFYTALIGLGATAQQVLDLENAHFDKLRSGYEIIGASVIHRWLGNQSPRLTDNLR